MGEVVGGIKWTLRAEGLLLLILGLYVYASYEFSWLTFAIFFLLPDVSFIGYAITPKAGAIAYNFAHSLVGAILVTLLGLMLDYNVLLLSGIIWVSHIGFDRALGYGLKYGKGFGFTHLGKIGKQHSTA